MSTFNASKCFLFHPERTFDRIFEGTIYTFGPEREKVTGSWRT